MAGKKGNVICSTCKSPKRPSETSFRNGDEETLQGVYE